MGILGLITGGLLGRREASEEYSEEELVPGPMRTEELKGPPPQRGILGGERSLEHFQERTVGERVARLQEGLRERQRQEDEEKAAAAAEEEPEPAIRRNPLLESPAEKFSRRVKRGHLFGMKTYRTVHRLEKGVTAIESAQTANERRIARWRFRHKVLPKLEKRAQSYFDQELGELKTRQAREVARLQSRGASDSEVQRALGRFESKGRELRRDVDRRLGRPLRGLWRRIGGSGSGWRVKY